jgi:hypothetical protein
MKKPFESGHPITIYRATKQTRLRQYEIPTEFSVHNYVLIDDGAELFLRLHLSFFATNVAPLSPEESLRPTILSTFQAYDYRFSDQVAGEAILYAVTGFPLLSRTDPIVLQALTNKLSEIEQRRRGSKVPLRKRVLLVIAFLTVAALPLIFYGASIRRQTEIRLK